MDKETVEDTDATEEVATEEVEVPEPVEGEEEATPTPKEEAVDYEAIEKEENEKKPDPEKAREAFKARQEKREVEVEEEGEQPLTESRMKQILAENNSQTQKILTQNSAKEIARKMSSSEAEAKAIFARWSNRMFPDDMPIGEQIEEMYISVNRKRIISERDEAFRALKGKEGTSKDSASTHKDPPKGSEPKLSPADAQGYKLAGLIWDGKMRLYKKQLDKQGKKFMFKDPKTGKQWVA